MATSGTTAFAPDVSELIEEAASRAGYEVRSGFEYQSAVRSMNLLCLDWANRGINLWLIEQGTFAITAGTSQYLLPADTIDIIELMVRTGSTDYRVERIGASTYAQISNKTIPGRPSQAWIERRVDQPRVNLWPTPAMSYTGVYWRLRRIQDAGSASSTPDLPFRLWPAFVAGLAYYLALKNPASLDRAASLKLLYEEELQRALDEDRGRESFYIGIASS